MKTQIVIWGTGGHALVVADIIRAGKDYALAGFLVDAEFQRLTCDEIQASVLGGKEQLDALRRAGVSYVLVAVGDCHMRLELADMLLSKGFSLATAIHPRAVVAPSIQIGAGTVVAAGAVINPGAVIGKNVIINTGATVDHECVIEDGAHISPGAHLAGRVHIGRATWVGIGAAVINDIRIGANSVVGAGAVVVNDIPDNVVAYGVPARVVKENRIGD
jgi:acetyltransferase EpsM